MLDKNRQQHSRRKCSFGSPAFTVLSRATDPPLRICSGTSGGEHSYPDRAPTALEDPGYEECHVRGEILSGAVLNAFVEVWRKRLEGWLPRIDKTV